MKKSTKLICIIAVVVVAIPLGMYIAGNYYFTNARIYEEYWHINLPRTVQEEYSKKTDPGFHGDGISYTIFQYDNSASHFTNSLTKEKNTEMEEDVSTILLALSVEKGKQPDFSHSYLWLQQGKEDGSKLYIIYDPDTEKLYMVQQTI